LLTHPTLDLLHQLGLNGMAKAFGEIEATGEAATLSRRMCSSWIVTFLFVQVVFAAQKKRT
jgi:hypothetical protein